MAEWDGTGGWHSQLTDSSFSPKMPLMAALRLAFSSDVSVGLLTPLLLLMTLLLLAPACPL